MPLFVVASPTFASVLWPLPFFPRERFQAGPFDEKTSMKYGYFDDPNREYVITNPKTPDQVDQLRGDAALRWVRRPHGRCSCCARAIRRSTASRKYIPQLPGSQFKGQHAVPALSRRRGLRSVLAALRAHARRLRELRVPRGARLHAAWITKFCGVRTEITRVRSDRRRRSTSQDVRITNETGEPLALDAIPVLEYTHFDALKQFTNADWVPQTMMCKAHRDGGQARARAVSRS